MKEIEQTCEKLHNLALNNNKKVKALKKDYPAKKKDKKKFSINFKNLLYINNQFKNLKKQI